MWAIQTDQVLRVQLGKMVKFALFEQNGCFGGQTAIWVWSQVFLVNQGKSSLIFG